jgi:hypothetical protein
MCSAEGFGEKSYCMLFKNIFIEYIEERRELEVGSKSFHIRKAQLMR